MAGLLMDTCNNVTWKGSQSSEAPNPKLMPPTGGDQAASVVITGDSSEIVFQNCEITGGGSGVYCKHPFAGLGRLFCKTRSLPK